MTADPRWERLMDLFDRASEVPAASRAAWLAEACGDDQTLLHELEEMLAAGERSQGILDRELPPAAPGPDPIPALAEALRERYLLERELGEGGMGRVFLAHELKHGRRVVLKALKPEVARLFGRDRFLREVQILAQLAHPHIVGLIDSGEAGALLYYVMPYLEGETLRDRIQRGPLELSTAVSLLRDAADALRHAHRAGVVHRDLKPSNVLCVGDHAYLLDFGIAKLVQERSVQEPTTAQGFAVGTPAYMAPEQRVGDPSLDHRADLYAWGVMAYECLTGELPTALWLPVSAGDIAAKRPDVRPALARLIAACLSPDPADRPADADRLLRALEGRASSAVPAPAPVQARTRRRPLALLAVGGTAAAVAAFVLLRPKPPGDGSPIVRAPIAVSVFRNETGDPSLDPWGRLAGNWVTDGLQGTGIVPVVPWPTVLQASERAEAERSKGRQVDPVSFLRAEIGAGTVISGSFYRVGDSIQFHAQVSDAAEGRMIGTLPVISAPLGQPEVALAEVRRRIMGMVAMSADARVGQVPGLLARPPLFEAFQVFERALVRFRDQDYGVAAREFRHAYEVDPQFLSTLLYAATAHWNRSEFDSVDTLLHLLRERYQELNEYQRLRLETMEAKLAGDGPAQLAALRRSVEIAPHSQARYNLADVALEADRPQEARAALEALNPDQPDLRGWAPYWYDLTHARHLTGDHEGELTAARELRRRYPDRRAGLVFEVRALAAMGDTAGIEVVLREGQSLSPQTYWSQGAALVVAGEELMAHGYGQAGWPYLSRSVTWLDRQLELTPGDQNHRYWLGSALYDLGDWRRAYQVWLDLTREFPTRLSFRGMAAVSAARLRLPEADSILGEPTPTLRGPHMLFRARIATIRGSRDEALGLYSEAARTGVDGLPWVHAAAVYDLFLLGSARSALPFSLRVGLPPQGGTPPVP